MSQESSARQTQPALVKGRLARTSSPTMAGGAKHRKKRSARLGVGTGRWRTTSYQPHTPFPRDAMAEETANRIQAGRKQLRRLRAYAKFDTAATAAAALSPKSPMNRASRSDPQPSADPVAYPPHRRANTSCEARPDPPPWNRRRPVITVPGALTGSLRSVPPPCPGFRVLPAEAFCVRRSCGVRPCGCRGSWAGLCGPVRARIVAGGPAASDRSPIGRASPVAPLAVRLSVPGAELSTALPQSGRYTRLVTQGHSLSTLRDDQQRCAYGAHPDERGACAGAREAGPGGGGWASPEPALSPSSGRRSRAVLPPRTGSAARRAGAWPAARRRMWSRRRAG